MTTNKTYIVLIALALFVLTTKAQKTLDPQKEDPALAKKYNIHIIPDGKKNYRSGQIPKTELANFIKKYGIKHIIRFNGNGSDGRRTSSDPVTTIAEEKAICEANGCEFHYITPYQGYRAGQGYVTSNDKVIEILKKGNALVHCRHGQDRTGGHVGGYLKRTGFMTDPAKLWKYTTDLNGWKTLIKRGQFYGTNFAKYAEIFITIPEIKKLQ